MGLVKQSILPILYATIKNGVMKGYLVAWDTVTTCC